MHAAPAVLALALLVPAAEDAPASRTFRFTYAATLTGLRPGQLARVWVPVPPDNEDQAVRRVATDLPAPPRAGRDPTYGNEVLFFEARADAAGTVPLRLVYRVVRREAGPGGPEGVRESAALLDRLRKADRLVPVGGRPQRLLAGRELPADDQAAARVIYDVVNAHMRYSKEGTGWGRGDAEWACDSGRGNCSDFHSLFIALARAREIPCKFEVGFPLPPRRGAGEVAGYHCWAKFRPAGKGWVPVDVSEASKDPARRDYYFGRLTPDRVAFSTGRDLELVPRQAGPPLNFFVYPYAEVDGKPWPDEKIRRQFRFRDEDGASKSPTRRP
jgi:transglutaminase-like putative cysteine protease